MKNILSIFTLLFISFGCSIQWTEAIRKGELGTKTASQQIDVEVKNGLVILPVTISGTTYRFLFDSGAPLSISEKVQQQFSFKTISKGFIVDSEKHRSQVNYVRLDSLSIGETIFLKQTAFVGDFESNPIIKCMNIDGIIGSNLIRFCNWELDIDKQKLGINLPILSNQNGIVTIPFRTDNQYNMFIDVSIGVIPVKNILIDYGSNGSLSLPSSIFTTLQERNIFNEVFHEHGFSNSGIVGKRSEISRNFTYLDSLRLGDLIVENVALNTGNTGSIGTQLLSRYTVTIDWNSKLLHFQKKAHFDADFQSFGFSIGSKRDQLYIQSVVDGLSPDQQGIVPGLQILKLDSMDFHEPYSFCDFMNYYKKKRSEMVIEVVDSLGQLQKFTFKRETLKSNESIVNPIDFEKSPYGLIFTTVKVNGTDVKAMIDFGDPNILQLSSRFVEREGISVAPSNAIAQDMYGNTFEINQGIAEEVRVGDWKKNDIQFSSSPGEMESVSEQINTQFDAVVGWGYFSQFYIEMDYKQNKFLLHKKKPTLGAVYASTVFNKSSNYLSFPVEVQSEKVNLIIDTGSPTSILDSTFYHSSELKEFSLQFGNQTLPLDFELIDFPMLKQLDAVGIIGGDFLENYIIHIDPFENRIEFVK